MAQSKSLLFQISYCLGLLFFAVPAFADANCIIQDPNALLSQEDIQSIQDVLTASLEQKGTIDSLTKNQEACVQAFKQNVAGRMILPFEIKVEPKLNPMIHNMNFFISSGLVDPGAETYSRASSKKNRVNNIEMDRNFKGPGSYGQYSVDVTYNLTATIDGYDGEKRLFESIEATLYKDDKTVAEVSQSAYLNDNCEPQFVNHSQTTYKLEGPRTLVRTIQLGADGKSEENEVHVDTSAIEFSDKLAKVSRNTQMIRAFPQHLENKSFGGTDSPDGYVKMDRFEIQNGAGTFPHLLRAQTYLNSQPMETMVIGMSADFTTGFMKSTSPRTPNDASYSELISKEAWERTKLEFIDNNIFKSESFDAKSIQADSMKIALDTEAPLEFDNWSAYGQLALASKSDGKNHYVYESVKTGAPTPRAIDSQHYTRETKFYDYHSKNVADIISLIQSKNLKTRADTVIAILSELSQRVQYNYDALETHSVRSMKASQTLQEKTGVCQNISALFIAIARGLGIPARMIQGPSIAVPANADGSLVKAGMHAWAEVSLDGKTWTPLEPQNSDHIGLDRRGYIPIGESMDYETLATEVPKLTDDELVTNLKIAVKNYKQ